MLMIYRSGQRCSRCCDLDKSQCYFAHAYVPTQRDVTRGLLPLDSCMSCRSAGETCQFQFESTMHGEDVPESWYYLSTVLLLEVDDIYCPSDVMPVEQLRLRSSSGPGSGESGVGEPILKVRIKLVGST